MNIKEHLKTKKLILDGAMGTYYSKITEDSSGISENANITNPEIIKKIHMEYISAGSNIIRTNSFAASKRVLGINNNKQKEIISKAYTIAKEAVSEFEREIYIGADIGPIPEYSDVKFEDRLDEYKTICDIFQEEGAEIFIFETFPDLKYIESLAPYIKEKNENAFIIVNFCVNKNGYTSSGYLGERLFVNANEIEEIDSVGFNCGIGSGHMNQLIKTMNIQSNKYIGCVPNAGYPESMQNRMIFIDNANYFVENMKEIAAKGINILGGCCGTTPEYIKLLSSQIDINITKENINKEQCEHIKVVEENLPNIRKEYKGIFSKKKVIAVELDPPFDAQDDKIMQAAHELKKLNVDIITFADSPMGRSRVDSIMMGIKIANETKLAVMPHICCRDKNMISMRSGILGAHINGIRNLLIVTGDPLPSVSRASTTGVFDYNSIRLMEFVKEMNIEHFANDPICYGGALNYARGKIETVIDHMNRKIQMGATYFLTQPVYSKEDIERIYEIKKRVDSKILCGIMPLVSYKNAKFIKNEITGINVPDEIIQRYNPNMSKEEAEWVAASISKEIMEKLDEFSDGYYFMLPFNRTSLLNKILV